MTRGREMRQFLDRVERAGCTVEKRRSGHYKITTPRGGQIFCSGTPTDIRSIANLKSQLNRYGVYLN